MYRKNDMFPKLYCRLSDQVWEKQINMDHTLWGRRKAFIFGIIASLELSCPLPHTVTIVTHNQGHHFQSCQPMNLHQLLVGRGDNPMHTRDRKKIVKTCQNISTSAWINPKYHQTNVISATGKSPAKEMIWAC